MQSAIIILFESKLAPSRPSPSLRNPVKTTFSSRQQQLQLFQDFIDAFLVDFRTDSLKRTLTVSFCSCGRIFSIMLKLISSPGPKFYPLCIYYEGFRLKCVAEHRFCKKRLKNDFMQKDSANPWKFNRISECNKCSYKSGMNNCQENLPTSDHPCSQQRNEIMKCRYFVQDDVEKFSPQFI